MEGGYFVETDRDTIRVPSPFGPKPTDSKNASTTIHYLLTPATSLGSFHRNRARTVHTLHRGRARYVIIHADEVSTPEFPGGYSEGDHDGSGEDEMWRGRARIETFVVGPNVLDGEKLQWIVEGGKYKASFLLPDEEGGTTSDGCLISETVVPGFEFEDHDFMRMERLEALASKEQRDELAWLIRKE